MAWLTLPLAERGGLANRLVLRQRQPWGWVGDGRTRPVRSRCLPEAARHHSRFNRAVPVLDDCGPFRAAEGELAAGGFNRLSTPDPPHGFLRAGKIPDAVRGV